MDYYSILGISKSSSQDDIKKAYRKLASKHHPDRGGDTAQFQKIEEAYRILSDDQTRAQYDNPMPQYNFNTGNMNDMNDLFGAMFGGNPFGGGFRQQSRKNRNINIRVEMTLEEILVGKEVTGSIRLPSGKEQAIQLSIPQGVQNGDSIRFRGLGDDSIPNAPRGDVITQIIELPHPRFRRDGRNLYTDVQISVFDAMLGKTIRFNTLENKELEIKIPSGIQPGQLIKCDSYGLPAGPHNLHRGTLFIQVQVSVPKEISSEDRAQIEQLSERYRA
jgi:DnaJ-class molecular chaperone